MTPYLKSSDPSPLPSDRKTVIRDGLSGRFCPKSECFDLRRGEVRHEGSEHLLESCFVDPVILRGKVLGIEIGRQYTAFKADLKE